MSNEVVPSDKSREVNFQNYIYAGASKLKSLQSKSLLGR